MRAYLFYAFKLRKGGIRSKGEKIKTETRTSLKVNKKFKEDKT